MATKLILALVDDESNSVKHVLMVINSTFVADHGYAAGVMAENSRLTSMAFRGGDNLIFGDFTALEEALTPEQANEMSDHGAVLYTSVEDISRILTDYQTGKLKATSMDLADIHFDGKGFQASGVVKYDFTRVLSRHLLFSFLEETVTA